MISSIIWLVLLYFNYINPDNAPWKIYIPIVIVEIAIYFRMLFKWVKNEKYFNLYGLLYFFIYHWFCYGFFI